jgi:uncharacterized protein
VIALLDVNVLLALFDPQHQHHSLVRRWYVANNVRVATCALTELGFVRISTNPRYPNPMSEPSQALAMIRALHAAERHEFWACQLTLADQAFE